MRWITASQLEQWANFVSAADDLPGVVGDLIRASFSDISAMRFPSGDKGRIRGFDGHLVSTAQAFNIPPGHSFWEFGIEPDYKGKATREIEKRSGQVADDVQRESSFVFVTPRTWDSSKSDNKLEDWVAAQSGRFKWKSVALIDGAALETWLDQCPATAAWHARNTIKCAPRQGARSTDEFWREFSNQFSPNITEEVLLCDRKVETEQLFRALLGPPATVSFSADSPDEVIAFAVAAIRKADPEIRLFLEARTLVIDEMAAGRELLFGRNLIYLLRSDPARSPGQFAEYGPTIVSLGRHQRTGSVHALSRPSGQALGMALTTMGIPENEALTMARGCGKSLTVLARRYPGGSYEKPKWLQHGELVLPAILTGGWDSKNDGDKAIVQKLAGVADYYLYEGRIRQFPKVDDPPLDLEGTVWKVRAPIDAFIHAGHLIGPEHLELLRSVMTTVFGTIEEDPGPEDFARPTPSQNPSYSEWLRDGLATTLLMIAVLQAQADLGFYPGAGQRFADELVGNLPGLTDNHRLLASLRDELPLLAEAAPNPLLVALERMLEGAAKAIRPIFDERHQFGFPRSHHMGLLFALETLAWDPNYFDRAVMVLARLAAIDPGGKIGNRPIESLREIFILWNPNTNSSATQRLAALDEIIGTVPEVGWALTCMLLPSSYGTSMPTARPRLRDAGASERSKVTNVELWHGYSDVVRRAIKLAGHDSERWQELVPKLSEFPAEERRAAFIALGEALENLKGKPKDSLWVQLRKEVARHERFAAAQWALPEGDLQTLRGLVEKHAPPDQVQNVVWLVDTWSMDALDNHGEVERRRTNAIRDLYENHGLDAILRLGDECRAPYLVVQTLPQIGVDRAGIEELIGRSVALKPDSFFGRCLSGLLVGIVGETEATGFLKQHKTAERWTAETVANLLLSWPDQISTWHVARRIGPEVSAAYWALRSPQWIKGSKRELFRAVLQLLRSGRASAALKTALSRLPELPTKLLLRILDEMLLELNSKRVTVDSMMSYEVEKIFAELDRRADATDGPVAQREFAYFAMIERANRPLRIYRLLANDPEFYHQVLCNVFIGKNETPPEADEMAKDKWRIYYSLLSKFATLPGQVGDDVDVGVLTRWIDRVRELGSSTDRAEITDQYLGRIFAHVQQDPDGVWPLRAVRDQIERLKSPQVERGIQIERFNMRGPHFRALYQGGDEERGFAATYRDGAKMLKGWPRTVALLNAIAKNWEASASQEDIAASQRKMRS